MCLLNIYIREGPPVSLIFPREVASARVGAAKSTDASRALRSVRINKGDIKHECLKVEPGVLVK